MINNESQPKTSAGRINRLRKTASGLQEMSHTHANKIVIDGLSVSDGRLKHGSKYILTEDDIIDGGTF